MIWGARRQRPVPMKERRLEFDAVALTRCDQRIDVRRAASLLELGASITARSSDGLPRATRAGKQL